MNLLIQALRLSNSSQPWGHCTITTNYKKKNYHKSCQNCVKRPPLPCPPPPPAKRPWGTGVKFLRWITVIYIDGEGHLLHILSSPFRCWKHHGLRTGLTIPESLPQSLFTSSLQMAWKSNSNGSQILPPFSGIPYFSYPDFANIVSFPDRPVVGKELFDASWVN